MVREVDKTLAIASELGGAMEQGMFQLEVMAA